MLGLGASAVTTSVEGMNLNGNEMDGGGCVHGNPLEQGLEGEVDEGGKREEAVTGGEVLLLRQAEKEVASVEQQQHDALDTAQCERWHSQEVADAGDEDED